MIKNKKDMSKGLNWLDIDNDDECYMQNQEKSSTQKSSKGLPNGWTRATFILKEEYMHKIKACAYWERITIKELLEEALVIYLHDKEIPDIPSRKIRLTPDKN